MSFQNRYKLISVYVLICVLSDVGCFDYDEIIKTRKNHVVPEENMSEDWMSGQRNGRRIDRRLRAVDLGIELRRMDIMPRISELRSQLTDWAIGCKRGRCAKESDKASRDQ